MLQISSDHLLCVFRATVANDEVTSSPNADLVADVRRQNKLTLVPADFNLNGTVRQ